MLYKLTLENTRWALPAQLDVYGVINAEPYWIKRCQNSLAVVRLVFKNEWRDVDSAPKTWTKWWQRLIDVVLLTSHTTWDSNAWPSIQHYQRSPNTTPSLVARVPSGLCSLGYCRSGQSDTEKVYEYDRTSNLKQFNNIITTFFTNYTPN